MPLDPRKAAEELARRERALVQARSVTSSIRAELFDRQLAFIDDPSRNKAAICTRRAGKTSMWSRYCTIECLEKPGSLIRIWAINRLRAKQLLWEEFRVVFARYRIPVKMHETELTIRFENGSEIRLLGADKDKEAQKKRGDKTRMEVILEAQLFGPFLRTLVEDVAEPCLFDLRGTMCMEGTPGPVPTGYWYWITGEDDTPDVGGWASTGMLIPTGAKNELGESEKERVGAGWQCHRWGVLNNPHLPHAAEELAAIRKKRGWSLDTPTYVREYRGRWVKDDGVLFYKFNEGRNAYSLAEVQPWGVGWRHVLGWDLGFHDDMALVVWGWHPSRRELFHAAEWKKPRASAEEVVEQIQRWEKAGFNFIAKVADTGGGGRMYVEQVMRRTSQVFEAAKKTEKVEHVRLMNDDFLSGRIRIQEGSEYAMELSALPKDPDWDPHSGKPQGEDPRFDNHLCFVAGTRILTARGEVPIERVTTQDFVLTRDGWKPVVAAGCTGERAVISRMGLTGTPEHPVLTTGGWKRLDLIVPTDVVLYAWSILEQSSGADERGTDSPSRLAAMTACTTSPAQGDALGTFIGRSTKPLMGPSLVDGTSITATVTHSITTSRISKLATAVSTWLSTEGSDGVTRRLKRALHLLLWPALLRLCGIDPKRGARGIESTHGTSLSVLARSAPARNVARVSLASASPFFARPDARTAGTHESDVVREWITYRASVDAAADLSWSTSTASSETAVVYALSVAEQHEYFANGVLVSNCDAALYSWRFAMNYLDFEEPEDEEGVDERAERADEERLSRTDTETEWWEDETNGFD